MSARGRHLACVLCRDRKVKCDGGKPSCEKCIKAGETCSYMVNPKASRAELHETILQLNERIEQAEANQAEFMAQQQRLANCACRLPVSFDTTSFMGRPLALFDSDGGESGQSQTIFSTHGDGSPFMGTPGSVPLQNDAPDVLDLPLGHFFTLGPQLEGDMRSSPTPMVSEQAGLSLFPADVGSNPASTIPDAAGGLHQSQLPGFHNSQQDEWAWRTTPVKTGLTDDDLNDDDDNNNSDQRDIERLLQAFAALDSATVSAQHDIMGVADTTAVYAGYFRQSILDRKQSVEGLVKFLETVEQRMREVSRIASQQVLGQARRSREAVEACAAYRGHRGGQMGLNAHDEEQRRRRAQARSGFFHTQYDLSRTLSQQGWGQNGVLHTIT
ncbi:hypothetical protein ACO1O0_008817 [Amphichorda felina]